MTGQAADVPMVISADSGQDERRAQVMAALTEVEDPEIPLNVVDLGLIYEVEVKGPRVEIAMSLTSIGCPAAGMLKSEIAESVGRVEGVEAVDVNIVWSPPWTKNSVTEDGRVQLRMLGIAI